MRDADLCEAEPGQNAGRGILLRQRERFEDDLRCGSPRNRNQLGCRLRRVAAPCKFMKREIRDLDHPIPGCADECPAADAASLIGRHISHPRRLVADPQVQVCGLPASRDELFAERSELAKWAAATIDRMQYDHCVPKASRRKASLLLSISARAFESSSW